MRYARLGRSGLDVSRLGLDCQTLGVAQRERGWDPQSYDGQVFATRTIHAARDAGINMFDTMADLAGRRGQTLLGRALAGRTTEVHFAARIGRYDDVSDIDTAIESSLRRLRTDHLDILYLSDTNADRKGRPRPINDEDLHALSRSVDAGLVAHLGLLVSDPGIATRLIEKDVFDVVQMQCNIHSGGPVTEFLDHCARRDIGVGVIRPLAPESLVSVVGALDPDADDNLRARECCLRFLLSDPRVQLINVGMRWEHEVARNTQLFSAGDDAPLPVTTGIDPNFDPRDTVSSLF